MSEGEYSITATAIDNLNYTGSASVSISVELAPAITSLSAGWNLIAFVAEGSTNIEMALSSIWNYVEVVKDFSGFFSKTNPPELNSLEDLRYGCAYFIYVSENCQLQW